MGAIRRSFAFLTIGLALLASGEPGRAQDYLPGIQEIIDSGTLTVAVVDAELPPMIRRNDEGALGGFDVELAKDIARKLGVEARLVTAGPHKQDVIDMVARGQADLGLSYLTLSLKAGMRVYFTRPYMIEADTLLINRVKGFEFNRDCPGRSDLRRLLTAPGAVGLLEGGQYEALVDIFDPKAAPRSFESAKEMLQAVFEGDLTASLQGEVAAKYYLSRTREAAIRVRLCVLPTKKNRVAIAVRPGAADLLRWLDLYIEARGIIVDTDALIYHEDRTLD